MSRLTAGLTVLLLALAPATRAQDDIRVEAVRFHSGTTAATVSGSITGYETVDYHLTAEAGQQMHVRLHTHHGANYFNLLPPGSSEEALFIGSSEGNEWSGTLSQSGTYTVRVYLMRSAARRGESARYTVEFSIDGAGHATQRPGSAAGDVAAQRPGSAGGGAWPAGTDASGMLPCRSAGTSLDRSAFSMTCDFRVTRTSSGATLWVMRPGDRRDPAALRVLYVESDHPTNTRPDDWTVTFSSDDDSDLLWDKVEDSWVVKVSDGERYWVPLAVITGD